MKNYLVIGDPIEHSLSPELHNHWINKCNIDAVYKKKLVAKNDLENLILKIRSHEIDGVNVTIPHKNGIIKYLDELSPESEKTQSVNTILKKKNKIIGHNTDIAGFELSLRYYKYDIKNKKVLVIGAGGVAPSIIYALEKAKAKEIFLMNRTIKKAELIKNIFPRIKVIEWGVNDKFDMIINATSLGLEKQDSIELDFKKLGNQTLFYDIIYNPQETNFMKKAKTISNNVLNGKMMFIYQAHQSFAIWHNTLPAINEEVIKLVS